MCDFAVEIQGLLFVDVMVAFTASITMRQARDGGNTLIECMIKANVWKKVVKLPKREWLIGPYRGASVRRGLLGLEEP